MIGSEDDEFIMFNIHAISSDNRNRTFVVELTTLIAAIWI